MSNSMESAEESGETHRLPLADIRVIKDIPFRSNIYDIVQELIHNALDAKATTIKIQLNDSGYSLISVSDNGVGIPEDNLPQLCNFFTTSKLHSLSEFAQIKSLGFKGTTLANLSCISNLTVTSRPPRASSAVKCNYQTNLLVSRESEPEKTGTTVEVRNLWFNYPEVRAERKSDTRQLSQTLITIAEYAIVFPHVVFEVTVEDRDRLKSTENKSKIETMRTLLRVNDTDPFHEAKFEVGNDLKGSVLFSGTKSQVTQAMSSVFLNNRSVKVPALEKAMTDWYNESRGLGAPLAHAFIITVEIAPSKMKLQYLLDDTVTLDDEPSIIQAMMASVAVEARKPTMPASRDSEVDLARIVSPRRQPPVIPVRRIEIGQTSTILAKPVAPVKTTSFVARDGEPKPVTKMKLEDHLDPVNLMAVPVLQRTRSVGDVSQEATTTSTATPQRKVIRHVL